MRLKASTKPHIHQKFEIFWTNIASTMGCPNSKNRPKKGLRPLGVKHSVFFYLHLCNNPNYKHYINDTLEIHELDFGILQHIGIPRKIKITYCSCMIQPDNSLCSPLVVGLAIDIAYQLNLEFFVYNVRRLHPHMLNWFKKRKMKSFLNSLS